MLREVALSVDKILGAEREKRESKREGGSVTHTHTQRERERKSAIADPTCVHVPV